MSEFNLRAGACPPADLSRAELLAQVINHASPIERAWLAGVQSRVRRDKPLSDMERRAIARLAARRPDRWRQ